MKVAKDTVVSIAYTLKDTDGNVLDTADKESPLPYLHGHGNLISGMENALDGRELGEQFEVVIPPEEAYGQFDDELVWELAKEQFDEVEEFDVGSQFVMEVDERQLVVEVVEIRDEIVIVDGNHQLADETLHFDVTVVDVRDATAEEIEYGRVQLPDEDGNV